MSQVQITPISTRKLVGEGPYWMEKDQCLVYVDIPNGNLHRYFYETKTHQRLHVEDIGTGDTVSFAVPIEGHKDEFVIGMGRTLASVEWSSEESDNIVKKPRPLLLVDRHDTNTRFNDAKCDPAGRLWAGTMSIETEAAVNVPHKGTLYRIDPNLKSSVWVQKITISNGLSWSNDKSIFYFIDSMDYSVDAFDYNHAAGNISNRRVVIDFKASGIKGIPDGMASDTNGNLWVACYNGNQVICIDPTVGKVIRNIEFPVRMPTSCCWGGPNYSTLFVTSAGFVQEELNSFPDSGKTFAVTGLGAKGMASNEFKVDEMYLLK